MTLKGRDIISLRDVSREDIERILEVADKMDPKKRTDLLKDYILASLFFEASTRTRLSFESAMHRLGGAVIGFANPKSSRAGDPRFAETLMDTIRMVESYADVIVIRHNMEGAAELAAKNSKIPVINAGDGFLERSGHPTQALLDLYTIKKEKGKIDGLNIAFMGNQKYVRALHSMAYALANFDIDLIFVSPKEFRMPENITEHLRKKGIEFRETENLEDIISSVDVLYVESIPHKLLAELSNAERARMVKYHSKYRLSLKELEKAKEELIILHPLPRSDELGFQIFPEVDETKYAKYFEEAANGVPVRMAILALVLDAL